MAYNHGAIDAALAAAVGDEPLLIAELRLAFVASVEQAVAVMTAATDAEEWDIAARRLKGLAASFGAVRLMALATTAAAGEPQDAVILNDIHEAMADL
jgi:HPt (histidine-containing phosphotransfer) domain-containing protein